MEHGVWTPGNESAGGITIDRDGRVVVVGSLFGNPGRYEAEGFGNELWPTTSQAYVAILSAATGAVLDVANLPADESLSHFTKVSSKSGGGVYATGRFQGSIVLGLEQYTSNGGEDAMFVEFDGDLNVVAAMVDGGAGNDTGRYVAEDPDGRIVVSGTRAEGNGSSYKDMFVAKLLDGLGSQPEWERSFGSDHEHISKNHRIAFIDGADILMSGFFNEGVTSLDHSDPYNGGQVDGFVMRLNGDSGSTVWARGLGGNDLDSLLGLAVDVNNDIVVVGRVSDTSTNEDGVLGIPVDTGAGSRVFMMKFEADGTPVWAHRIVGPSRSELYGVAIDAQGNGYAGGRFRESLTVGDDFLQAADKDDAFLMKFAP